MEANDCGESHEAGSEEHKRERESADWLSRVEPSRRRRVNGNEEALRRGLPPSSAFLGEARERSGAVFFPSALSCVLHREMTAKGECETLEREKDGP